MKLFRVSTVPISLNILLKGQLAFLNRHFEVTAVSGAGPDLTEVATREGVEVYPLTMARQIDPQQDLKSLWALYRLFKKEKPLIVHSITPKAGLLSMTAARMAGVPVRMHTFTGLIFPHRSGAMQKLLIQMDRLLCANATHIYPEGEGVKTDLLKYDITRKPLKVLANGNVNGVDLEYFDPVAFENRRVEIRRELGIAADAFVYVFVGRLVRDKGLNELVAAYSKLVASDNRLKLLLVGPFEQDLDPLLPETLEKIKDNPDIITTGFQADIRPYLAATDALAFPSYREGFPNVVLQAGAMGLPAIVTDISGSNEIISDGENGLIVPPKDESALFASMQRLASDQSLYSNLKKSARASIAARFSKHTVWNAVLEEYRQAVADLPPAKRPH